LPFDATKSLTDAESQTALLADAFENGEAASIVNALKTVARARGMSKVARAAGITREGLYKALDENRNPRLSTLLGVAKALGVQLSVKQLGRIK
jgi:probable addiction module antidote protein